MAGCGRPIGSRQHAFAHHRDHGHAHRPFDPAERHLAAARPPVDHQAYRPTGNAPAIEPRCGARCAVDDDRVRCHHQQRAVGASRHRQGVLAGGHTQVGQGQRRHRSALADECPGQLGRDHLGRARVGRPRHQLHPVRVRAHERSQRVGAERVIQPGDVGQAPARGTAQPLSGVVEASGHVDQEAATCTGDARGQGAHAAAALRSADRDHAARPARGTPARGGHRRRCRPTAPARPHRAAGRARPGRPRPAPHGGRRCQGPRSRRSRARRRTSGSAARPARSPSVPPRRRQRSHRRRGAARISRLPAPARRRRPGRGPIRSSRRRPLPRLGRLPRPDSGAPRSRPAPPHQAQRAGRLGLDQRRNVMRTYAQRGDGGSVDRPRRDHERVGQHQLDARRATRPYQIEVGGQPVGRIQRQAGRLVQAQRDVPAVLTGRRRRPARSPSTEHPPAAPRLRPDPPRRRDRPAGAGSPR